jgi:hypothetical protein
MTLKLILKSSNICPQTVFSQFLRLALKIVQLQ